MNRYLGWALKGLGVYVAFLIIYFLFALASIRYETFAFYERKINPSTFVFWQAGELYSNPPLFSDLMTDSEGQLSTRELEGFADVDIWVLLLEGFEDIKNVEFASQLGIDVEEMSSKAPDELISLQRVSLSMVMHPVPIQVFRKQVLLINAADLRNNYKQDCLDELVYTTMINQRDQSLWDSCELT